MSISGASPRTAAWKLHFQPYDSFIEKKKNLCICNYFIKCYISAAHSRTSSKGSLASWPRAPLTYAHQHPSSLSPFSHPVLLSLSLSLRHRPAVPDLPRADWSQEGATFLNSWEDWVTQSRRQAVCGGPGLAVFHRFPTAMIQMEF